MIIKKKTDKRVKSSYLFIIYIHMHMCINKDT